MILEEKLNFDLLKSLDMRKFMQIHTFKLILNCTYKLINFQDDNDKDVYLWSFDQSFISYSLYHCNVHWIWKLFKIFDVNQSCITWF